MNIHTLKTGMRVRWTESTDYAVDDERVARSAFRAGTPADTEVQAGVAGTVVREGDKVRVVIDDERRVFGAIDEVEWQVDGSFTASHVALRVLEVTGMIDSCPECGNASLFDSDCKRSEWTLFCVNPEKECGMTVLTADLSEEARLEAKATIEKDEPILTEIRDIIDGFDTGEDDSWFEETCNEVAFKLLALVNKHRAELEEV
jgi:hypothetical protein